jgi:hypothetical protein
MWAIQEGRVTECGQVKGLTHRRCEPLGEFFVDVQMQAGHRREMEGQQGAAAEVEPSFDFNHPKRQGEHVAGTDHQDDGPAERGDAAHYENDDERQRQPHTTNRRISAACGGFVRRVSSFFQAGARRAVRACASGTGLKCRATCAPVSDRDRPYLSMRSPRPDGSFVIIY